MRDNANVRDEHPVDRRTESAAFKAVCNLQSLMKAEERCHRGVGYKNSVARYHSLALSRNYDTLCKLRDGTYKTSKGDDFTIYEPKVRIVTSTRYKDRIPQASFVVNWFYPNVAPQLIDNNFACLKGKGVEAARNALKDILRESSLDDEVYKVDLKDYFGSIIHDTLIEETSPMFDDEWAVSFLSDVVNSNGKPIGITLGSEINQLSAVSLLNRLDHILGNGRYIRYMDDFIFIGSKETIRQVQKIITSETSRLGLKISEKKTYVQPVKNPIKFLGFTFLLHPSKKVTMKRIPQKYHNEIRKLKRMKKAAVPIDGVLEHARCVRANLKKGNRSTLLKYDKYFNNLFREELKNMIEKQNVALNMSLAEVQCISRFVKEASDEDMKIEEYIRFGLDEEGRKYSMSQELCLLRKKLMGTLSDDEWNEYCVFVEKCIEKARSEEN